MPIPKCSHKSARRYFSWDRFSCPSNAAIAFSLMHVDTALAIDRERGALIYRVGWDSNREIAPHYAFGQMFTGGRSNVISPLIGLFLSPESHPAGTQMSIAGMVHTHPVSSSGNVWFSPQDLQLARGERIPIQWSDILRDSRYRVIIESLFGRALNPFSPMLMFVTSRNPARDDAIQVRRYIPNTGLTAWGELIWQCPES
jgi:hypothetical protein